MSKLWKPTYDAPLVLDIETRDEQLLDLGPGVYRNDGSCVLGCGVYDPLTNEKTYYPLHANDLSKQYLNKSRAALAQVLATDREKLLANGAYDIDWLENGEHLPVNGFIHDIQLAEPLLDAYRLSYSLEALAKIYGVPGKQTIDIEREADKIDPNRAKKGRNGAAQRYLWLMPTQIVGDYCVGDLEATYAVWKAQIPLIKSENLQEVYECECNLIRIRMIMRKNGIRIDEKARLLAIDKVRELENSCITSLYEVYGEFNINSGAQIANVLLNSGMLNVPRTAKGNYSVKNEWLEKMAESNPLFAKLVRARKLQKLRTTFLEKSIIEHICPDGRLHGQFHQLRKDDAGTITGRWSSTDPNLQQIPRNDPELGAMARGMFVPDEGCWYGHTDYSQVEYRVFSHYARGWVKGDDLNVQAQAMRDLFNAHPETDYHQFVIDTVRELTGVELSRPTAKRVNFGVLYFMGETSLSKKFNIPIEEARQIYAALFNALPFIESTRQKVVNTAKQYGYVKTAKGRIQRIGPPHIAKGTIAHYGNRTVVGASEFGDKFYPTFNYLIQGTAADIMKWSLLACYESGVYDILKLHLLVHDETGVSIPKTKEGIEAYAEQKHLMETTVPLSVPIVAEADFGPNWGQMDVEAITDFSVMEAQLK